MAVKLGLSEVPKTKCGAVLVVQARYQSTRCDASPALVSPIHERCRRFRRQKSTVAQNHKSGQTSTHSATSEKVGHCNVGGHHYVGGAIGSGSDQLSVSGRHNR
jgi:hypothetical protein